VLEVAQDCFDFELNLSGGNKRYFRYWSNIPHRFIDNKGYADTILEEAVITFLQQINHTKKN
jgi:hypothetical protein